MRSVMLAAAAALASVSAAAAEPFCALPQDGAVACLDGKLCVCRFDPEAARNGRRGGPRWDCGALRPACGPPAAADGPAPQPLFLPFPPAPPPVWR